jgi:hypothetical protein
MCRIFRTKCSFPIPVYLPEVEPVTVSTLLLIILIVILIGALPSWPHSRGWGYYPSGGLGLVLLIVVILLLLGYI